MCELRGLMSGLCRRGSGRFAATTAVCCCRRDRVPPPSRLSVLISFGVGNKFTIQRYSIYQMSGLGCYILVSEPGYVSCGSTNIGLIAYTFVTGQYVDTLFWVGDTNLVVTVTNFAIANDEQQPPFSYSPSPETTYLHSLHSPVSSDHSLNDVRGRHRHHHRSSLDLASLTQPSPLCFMSPFSSFTTKTLRPPLFNCFTAVSLPRRDLGFDFGAILGGGKFEWLRVVVVWGSERVRGAIVAGLGRRGVHGS
ncbi:hypothetical protein GQ457_15G012850 [Hibiscus cannabinus]